MGGGTGGVGGTYLVRAEARGEPREASETGDEDEIDADTLAADLRERQRSRGGRGRGGLRTGVRQMGTNLACAKSDQKKHGVRKGSESVTDEDQTHGE